MKKLYMSLVAILMIAFATIAQAQKDPGVIVVVQPTFSIKLSPLVTESVTVGSEINLNWQVFGSGYHGRLSVVLQGKTPGTDVSIITPCYKGADGETCNDQYVPYGRSSDQVTFYIPSSILPGWYAVRVSVMDHNSTVILADDTTRSFEVVAQPATIKWLRDGVSFTWPAGTVQNVKVLTDGLQGNWLGVSLVDVRGASVPGYTRYLIGTNVLDGVNSLTFNIPTSLKVGRYYLRFQSYDYVMGNSIVRTEDTAVINVTSAVTAPTTDNKLVAGRRYKLTWNVGDMPAEHVMVHLVSSKDRYWHAYVATVVADKGTAIVRIPFSIPAEGGDDVHFVFSSMYLEYPQQFQSGGYTVVGGHGKPSTSYPGIGMKQP